MFDVHKTTEQFIEEAQNKFDKAVKERDVPPFNSAPTYDAKGWSVMTEWYKTHKKPEKVLYWNVA